MIRPGLQNKEISYEKKNSNNVIRIRKKVNEIVVDNNNNNEEEEDVGRTYTNPNVKIDIKKNKDDNTINIVYEKKIYNRPKKENEQAPKSNPTRKKYEKFDNYEKYIEYEKFDDKDNLKKTNPIREIHKTVVETFNEPEEKEDRYNKYYYVEEEERTKPFSSNDYAANRKLNKNKYRVNKDNDQGNNSGTFNKRKLFLRNERKNIPERYCRYNTESKLVNDLGNIEDINVNNYLEDDLAEIYDKIDEEYGDLKNDVFYGNICNFEDRFGEFDKRRIPHSYRKFEINTTKENRSINDMINKYANRARVIRDENENYRRYQKK